MPAEMPDSGIHGMRMGYVLPIVNFRFRTTAPGSIPDDVEGPNDLDFDAEGNLFFTDPWATGPGPNVSDRSGAVYQYSRDGILRKVMDGGLFPNGIAVSPDNSTLAIGDCAAGRMWY